MLRISMTVTTRLPESLMSDVIARDDRTVEILWREPYVDADSLIQSQLAPLPAHLIEELFNRDKNAFATSTFWTSPDFVGDGPYRVTRWDHGIAIYLEGNPYFVFGPPKIDKMEFRAVQDGNTIVCECKQNAAGLSLKQAEQAVELADFFPHSAITRLNSRRRIASTVSTPGCPNAPKRSSLS